MHRWTRAWAEDLLFGWLEITWSPLKVSFCIKQTHLCKWLWWVVECHRPSCTNCLTCTGMSSGASYQMQSCTNCLTCTGMSSGASYPMPSCTSLMAPWWTALTPHSPMSPSPSTTCCCGAARCARPAGWWVWGWRVACVGQALCCWLIIAVCAVRVGWKRSRGLACVSMLHALEQSTNDHCKPVVEPSLLVAAGQDF